MSAHPDVLEHRRTFLARLPLFADLDHEDLDRLASMAEPVTIRRGERLMAEGEPGDSMFVVIDGRFDVTKSSGTDEVLIGTVSSGDVVGEMALLEGCTRTASVDATADGSLLRLSRAAFEEFVTFRPTAALAILATVTGRLRSTAALLEQREKLASLGQLAAGLAHELNNPAAAVRRSSSQLAETLAAWNRAAEDLGAASIDQYGREVIEALRGELVTRAAAPRLLDPLAASDLEGAVQAYLEQEGVDNAWEIAPPLVALGWELNSLADIGSAFPGPGVAPVAFSWLGCGAAVHALLGEVSIGAERISEIVRAVKTYTFMDQAPIQQVDVHEGLENTLVILRSKLKQGVTVQRDFAPELPRIEAYGSELNQVWTNLIDNAIDAMGGTGTIRLRTAVLESGVLVEICDTGPGIPPDIQRRVFEPFFTTKEPGVGTGLGLHIVYTIIAGHHHGRIDLRSGPAGTCFEIVLPYRLDQPEEGRGAHEETPDGS